MPPFRIVARHPDKGHHDHAWHQLGGQFDYQDEATAATATNTLADVSPQSLDVEEPVRPDPTRTFGEAVAAGYELKVQELVPTKSDSDTAEPLEAKWKDVG